MLDAAAQCVYVATAERVDDEMANRIEAHCARRGQAWRMVEAPIELAQAIGRESTPRTCLLVDCLTVWLGNLMHHGRDVDRRREILARIPRGRSRTGGAGRKRGGPRHRAGQPVGTPPFRDHAGRLNQAVARAAGNVHFVVAGIPMALKGTRRQG